MEAIAEMPAAATSPTTSTVPHPVIQRIKLLIAEAMDFGVDEIDADDNLILDLQMDDLDYVELVLACDATFGIKTPERDSFNVAVRDIAGDVAAALRADARSTDAAFRSSWGL